MALPKLLALSCLVALVGCTRNTVIVVAPQPVAQPIDPACQMTQTKTTVSLPGPLLSYAIIAFPPRARQAGVRIGCAGVFYHITPDGHVTDPHIAVESPPGVGFGEAVLEGLPRMLYQPHPADPTWHYLNVTLRNNLAPQSPAPGPAPAIVPRATGNPFNT